MLQEKIVSITLTEKRFILNSVFSEDVILINDWKLEVAGKTKFLFQFNLKLNSKKIDELVMIMKVMMM